MMHADIKQLWCYTFKKHKNVTQIVLIFMYTTMLLPTKSNGQQTLYNNLYTIACHNCFEKKYANNIDDVLSYTTTIELDIWDVPLIFRRSGSLESDWYVKHTFLQKGNKNCFGGSLAKCLADIENWSENNPDHNVITVFIDKKQGWSGKNGTRRPEDLDKLLLSIFGKEKIYTPGNFEGSEADLRTAVRDNKWGSLSSLKGKFIFIITDATFFRTRNTVLNKYLENVGDSAVCFIAPTIKKQQEISKPKGISTKNVSNVVFYNLNYKHSGLCTSISSNNYVNRVFKSPETIDKVNHLAEKKANFVALYNYKLNGKLQ